jgi:hypothetical protein
VTGGRPGGTNAAAINRSGAAAKSAARGTRGPGGAAEPARRSRGSSAAARRERDRAPRPHGIDGVAAVRVVGAQRSLGAVHGALFDVAEPRRAFLRDGRVRRKGALPEGGAALRRLTSEWPLLFLISQDLPQQRPPHLMEVLRMECGTRSTHVSFFQTVVSTSVDSGAGARRSAQIGPGGSQDGSLDARVDSGAGARRSAHIGGIGRYRPRSPISVS